jgi:hypothetical protein
MWKIAWDLSAPVDTWYGVKVQMIKLLSLVDNKLAGTIPNEIT